MNPRTILLFLLSGTLALAGTVKHANPGNYRRMLESLTAGDTLVLAAGIYERGLPVSDCHGTPDAWISIQGPDTGTAEIRQAQIANCVELRQCSYVALQRLSIVGQGRDGIRGLFGISAQGGLGKEFSHSLGGQLAAGFVLTALYEDGWSDDISKRPPGHP